MIPAIMGMWKYGVGRTAQPPRVVRAPDDLLGELGAAVEVDPPERDAADERDHERRRGLRRDGQLAESGPRDDDRLAERDDEELAALGEVLARDRPLRRLRPTQPGHWEPEPDGRNLEDDGERPDREASVPFGQRARDPEDAGAEQPRGDALEVRVSSWRRPTTASTQTVRPTWMATKAPANSIPRSPNASGSRRT